MSDEPRGDIEIYEYFSQCLKIFRKRMLLFCKIANLTQQHQIQPLRQHVIEIIKQGAKQYRDFNELSQDNAKILPIFNRFVLRIRESAHNIALKTCDRDIVNFLNFVEHSIKQFQINSVMKPLIKIILVKSPKNVNNISPQPGVTNIPQEQDLSLSQSTVNNNVPVKNQSHFDSYDKYLQAIDREYRLFDCLDLDYSHYRRTFFMALEDQQKKDNNLFQDMITRNRYTKQSLSSYQRDFDAKKRFVQKRQKLFKTQTQISLTEIKPRKLQSNLIVVFNHQKSGQSTPKKPASVPKRTKTEFESKPKQQSFHERETPIILNTLHNFQSKRHHGSFKQTVNHDFIANHSLTKNCITQADTSTYARNFNVVPLKKINFRGNRIQLGPQQTEKKPLIKQQDRRRKLNNRAQQHFRKKISYISQSRGQKPINMGPEFASTTSKQQNFKSIRINKQQNFKSIRINYCKLEF